MDLDKALVSSLLAEGKAALHTAREKGLRLDLLEGEGKKAFEFLIEYATQYGQVPSADVVFGKIGILLETVAEPSAFFVDEVFNRALHNDLRSRYQSVVGLIEKAKPHEALDAIETLLRGVRKTHSVTKARVESIPKLFGGVVDYYDRIKSGARGVLTPWATINDETLGFWPEDLALFAARLGVGKCVHEDSEVVDPETGVVRTIREVVEGDQARVWTWSKERGIHTAPITAKVDTGRKRCLRFTFASGRSIVVTPEHPLLTVEGWKQADGFKVGMTAALPARVPGPEKSERLPMETVFLLALLLAEGSYTGHHVSFSSTDDLIIQEARQAAACFGVEVKPRGGCDYTLVSEVPIRQLLQEHGIDKTLAKNKRIPDAIYRLPLPQLAAFLTTFWMCDGYVDETGPGITLASERMVRQIQHLLLRLGVQSSVDYKKATCEGKEFDAWRLRIYASSWDAFAGVIHLYGHKQEKLEGLLARDRNSNVGFPRVSDAFVEEIKALVTSHAGRRSEGLLKQVGTRLGWSTYFGVRNLFGKKGSLFLRRFQAFCEVYGVTEQYGWLWSEDLFWDVVENIEEVGEQKIYDLTVALSACFVANDILVHNTWMAALLGHYAWSKGHRVLFATTEMSRERVAMRFAALHFRLPYGRLRKAMLTAFEEQKFRDGVKEVMDSEGLYVIGGDFDFRPETYEMAVEESEPDLSIFDGAYLLKTEGSNRFERAANAFDELKRICKRTGVPNAVTMQLNREAAKTGASVEKLALTDVAGWNADLVYGLVQTEDMKRDRRMTVKPLKVREGEGEEFEINWDLDNMNFVEVPKAGAGDAFEDIFDSGVSGSTGGEAPF